MSTTASTVKEKWDQEASVTHSTTSSVRVAAWNQIASSTKEVRRRSVNMLPTPTADLKPKEKVKRLGWIHAFGMILVFFVFLSSIYTSQEPYRFMSSNLALQRALLIDDLKQNKSLNVHGIWRWLETVISQIGGHTVNNIEANCAYSEFKEQVVNIDGKDYNLLDPSRRTASCPEENMSHINGAEEPTYLAGSHQLLSFGVFTKRSIPHEPVRGSVNPGSHLHEIPSDDIHSIDPAHDHKVAELCHVDVKPPSGDFNDTICILIDGFKDKIGTSLNWPGHVIKSPWDGHEYYAFESGSSATLFRNHHYETVYPCYSFKNYTTSTGEDTYFATTLSLHDFIIISSSSLECCFFHVSMCTPHVSL